MAKSKSESNINSLTYDQALQELQGLIDRLMADQTSIDHLFEHVSRANALVKFCQEKLRTIEGMIKEEVEN
ncbi:MAG TPA: exodeoxyribonuclease VII small subunit [Saprospiraceae bacterium]|nr:exodeoxyribonuclease VII small subunit [Saprospiraceae bacterium]